MRSLLMVGLTGVLLSGCAGRYVDLYVATVPLASDTVPKRVTETLRRLHSEATTYRTNYKDASVQADVAQLPLLGAAVATALIAINKPTNAAERVGKIGIGAGAYATTRSLFEPQGGLDTLRKGVDAINCVIVEGGPFVDQKIETQVSNLTSATNDLDMLNSDLAAAIDATANVPADKKDKVELARANAKLARLRADAASQAARLQIGAYENAPTEFERAATSIVSTLASKTANRTAIDVAALAASWTKAPAAAGDAGAQGVAESSVKNLLDKLDGGREGLNGQISEVTALTSGLRLADGLKAVVKCPATI